MNDSREGTLQLLEKRYADIQKEREDYKKKLAYFAEELKKLDKEESLVKSWLMLRKGELPPVVQPIGDPIQKKVVRTHIAKPGDGRLSDVKEEAMKFVLNILKDKGSCAAGDMWDEMKGHVNFSQTQLYQLLSQEAGKKVGARIHRVMYGVYALTKEGNERGGLPAVHRSSVPDEVSQRSPEDWQRVLDDAKKKQH